MSRGVARAMVRFGVRPVFAAPIPPAAQRLLATAATAGATLPPDVLREPGLLGSRPVEIHTPAAPTPKVVLYLHGGAFMLGGPATHRALASHLASAVPAQVFVLDYRLAPEHPHPAALDDCITAYEELIARGHLPADIAVVGDSAGGWLALATAISLRDRGAAPFGSLALISPWVDLAVADADWDADAMLSRAWLERSAAMYLGEIDPHDPRVDLTTAALAGLPPTVVQVGDEEALLGDATALAGRLDDAGVPVVLQVLPGLWHVAQTQAGTVEEATAAVRDLAASLF